MGNRENCYNQPKKTMFNPGQILQNRYELQQKLGRTAAGRETWLAIDLTSEEKVTVKLLAFSPQMQWEELKLFEREAQVLQALNHPRIPRYRDYFSLEREIGLGMPWFGLVQDYIPGKSLQDLLDGCKRFTEKEIGFIAREVIDILIYLHELSPPVLHRDIKPSNLLLGEDNNVYLVDFGSVQAQAAVTGVTFTVVGTSGYAPLEQFWGRAVAASDLYALGATLVHLLTGVAPSDLPQKDGRIQFANRTGINSILVNWIKRMIEPAIEKRFATARIALGAIKFGEIQSLPKSQLNSHTKISKPSKTKINLIKDKIKLIIDIPMIKRSNLVTNQLVNNQIDNSPIYWNKFPLISAILYFLSAVVLVLCALGFIFGILLTFAFLWPMLIMFWPILLAIIIFCLIIDYRYHTLNALTIFPKKYFYLTKNNFEINRVWLISTDNIGKGKTKDIVGVFNCFNEQGYTVNLQTENITYTIGEKLTEEESMWVVQEIQYWLEYSQVNS